MFRFFSFWPDIMNVNQQNGFTLSGTAMNTSKETGSTLVEVIVAMFILSLVIVGLNAGVVSLIRSNINAKELAAASSAGYSLFEELRRGDYTTMINNGTSTDTVRSKYVRNWRLTSDTTKSKIDLTIRWPLTSLKRSVALSTIISKP